MERTRRRGGTRRSGRWSTCSFRSWSERRAGEERAQNPHSEQAVLSDADQAPTAGSCIPRSQAPRVDVVESKPRAGHLCASIASANTTHSPIMSSPDA
eukprot:243427-Rhodomonas_salina.1